MSVHEIAVLAARRSGREREAPTGCRNCSPWRGRAPFDLPCPSEPDRRRWIFPPPHSDAASGHRARIDRSFADAVERAELDAERLTPRVMRHTAITRLVEAGVDLPTVQRISGHKTLKQYSRFARFPLLASSGDG